MTSVSITDSQTALSAYQAIVRGEASWLLLTFPDDKHDQLSFQTSGGEGLPGLKRSVADVQGPFIAFYRHDATATPQYILINYIPPSVPGIRRARLLVQSRRLGTLFTAHQATFTIEHLSDLTPTAISEALAAADTDHYIEMGRSIPQFTADTSKDLPNSPHATHSMWHSRSPSSTSPRSPSFSFPITKTAGVITSILRRKKPSQSSDDESAPPTPPKDKGVFSVQQPHTRFMSTHALNTQPVFEIPAHYTERANSLSEFAEISHRDAGEPDVLNIRAPPAERTLTLPAVLESKWGRRAQGSQFLDPAELQRRKAEAQRRIRLEKEEVKLEEAERLTRVQRQKEEKLRMEMEENERRRLEIENEVRRAAAIRQRKAQMEQEEEARRQQQIEERRRTDRERRLEEHRRLERWRTEHAHRLEEIAKRAEESRRREEAEKQAQIKLVEAKIRNNSKRVSLVSGWVTIQTEDSLTWKRRFYKISDSWIELYRGPQDADHVLDRVQLRGTVKGLLEWNEGFEQLESIPHSFAVEFADNRPNWSIFSDTEEEKIKLMGLLHFAAGL